jgi:putative MATE family efflux protein
MYRFKEMFVLSEESSQLQFERMTATPVHKLVLGLAVPTIISMLITNLYNMADTYFVSNLGTSASGATGVVFGLMAIIQSFGFMFGHGAGSNISRQLGSKHIERARIFSATAFYLSLVFGGIILLVGIVFQTPLMRVLGSTNSILPYAKEYSLFILLAAPAMTSSCVMNNILRYEGKAAFAMVGLASGSILNIFGDWLLIIHLKMGIMGAGISTGVSQYIGMIILMMPFLKGKVQSSFNIKYLTLRRKVIGNIISVGMPSMMRQGLNSVSVMVLNLCARPYGDAAIAAMSITSRIVNLMFCISVGISQGFQPVSAFNYGARKYSRVKEASKFTCLVSVCIMCVTAGISIVFAKPLITLFRDDAEVIKIGVKALRFQSASMMFLPVSLCGNMLFQSVGRGIEGTILASIRSGLIFIPILLILSHCFGIFGIQISQPIADLFAAAVTVPFMIHFFHTLPKDGNM